MLKRLKIDNNILFKSISKYECTEYKEKFDPFDSIEKTALYIAVANKNIEIVKLLLSQPKTDVNILYKNWSFNFDKYKIWSESLDKDKDYKGKEEYYNREEKAALHEALEKSRNCKNFIV